MLSRITLCLAVLALVVCGGANIAMAQDVIHTHLNDTVIKVKATDDPVQKRAILGENVDGLIKAIDTVQGSPGVSKEDAAGLDELKVALQEKSDELGGRNGFDPVPDNQLNAFSDYVVQDIEQAAETITISVVTLLLILIIIILIA